MVITANIQEKQTYSTVWNIYIICTSNRLMHEVHDASWNTGQTVIKLSS